MWWAVCVGESMRCEELVMRPDGAGAGAGAGGGLRLPPISCQGSRVEKGVGVGDAVVS